MRFHNFIQDVVCNPAQLACLQQLRQHPQLTGRELARQIGVSQFKIRATLERLVSYSLVRMTRTGRAYLYTLNKAHYLLTIVDPLFECEERMLVTLGQWVQKRLRTKPVSVVLYGSVARGDERPDSDIDLLLIYHSIDDESALLDNIHHWLADTSHYFGNHVAPTLTTTTAMKAALKKRDPFYKRILKEGRVIHGASVIEILS
jgi:predicted nucleotidyltransferase